MKLRTALRNISIKQKLIIGFGFMILSILVIGIFSSSGMYNFNKALNKLLNNSITKARVSKDIESIVYKLKNYFSEMASAANNRELQMIEDNFKRDSGRLNENLNKFKKFGKEDTIMQTESVLNKSFGKFEKLKLNKIQTENDIKDLLKETNILIEKDITLIDC